MYCILCDYEITYTVTTYVLGSHYISIKLLITLITNIAQPVANVVIMNRRYVMAYIPGRRREMNDDGVILVLPASEGAWGVGGVSSAPRGPRAHAPLPTPYPSPLLGVCGRAAVLICQLA